MDRTNLTRIILCFGVLFLNFNWQLPENSDSICTVSSKRLGRKYCEKITHWDSDL
jgi:hypothetical protein